jgi:hypothetical protein
MGIISERLTIVVCSKSNLSELERTLISLRKSDSKSPEIILILSGYEKTEVDDISSKFKTLISEIQLIPPSSIYDAMNFGLSRVTKEYVMFLNAGDTLVSYFHLEQLLYSLNDKLWGYGQINQIDPAGYSKIIKFSPYINCLHKNSFKYVPHPATIVQTKAIKDLGGFDVKYKVAADQKILIQLAKIQEPGICKLPVVNFYLGGASSRSSREIVKDYMKINHELHGPKMKSILIDRVYWKIVLIIRNLLNTFKKIH